LALLSQSDLERRLDEALHQRQEWQTAIDAQLDHLAALEIERSLTWLQVLLNLVEVDAVAWLKHAYLRWEEEEAFAKVVDWAVFG